MSASDAPLIDEHARQANGRDAPCTFPCAGESLFGVLTVPARAAGVGVVIVVGGPQYRVGSHRQFVLLARALAQAGIACLRFDHRGMGDSAGARRSFEDIGEDLRAAVDELCRQLPGLRHVVMWGLCDGASAMAFYAASDARIAGLVMVNPWVRTPDVEAKVLVRSYYATRVTSGAFWRKLVTGRVDLRRAIGEFRIALWRAAASFRGSRESNGAVTLADRIADALSRYRGRVLVVLSGNDRVASEFRVEASRPGKLASALTHTRAQRVELPQADHTFSTSRSLADVSAATIAWIAESFAAAQPRGERQPPTLVDQE